ncbi:MAG: ATP-binding protein [Anaerolineales bacterium]|uniref:ATP-binding protein n=1 Tax=Candidatus Desulfolinea nitratireducens TaxID=2841698 RepID=A0A8J6TJU3_9CHLR|nr:ATP-binding protein [Candidatus Desulfolinea nitratireducens]MBL6962079.1 ATP-binding protein [Anaerolineales bacterium]
MQIKRAILPQVQEYLLPGKVVVLYGPRQVGKTTLAHNLIDFTKLKSRFINADELLYREALGSQDRQRLGEVLGDAELLVIDEAQRVSNIGLNLKILVDSFPHIRILATGSASFDLANKISEPLTGRKITFTLYPISYNEIQQEFGVLEARNQLERWLIWGGYPAIVTTENPDLRARLLGELVGSYLYRDILEMEGVRRSEKIVDLLRLLAFQIGQEVSHSELATSLALNRKTVERYLDLLEKVFVIFRVGGFSRNLRKEITKNTRYYFYDNGVRNSLIQNFNSLKLRNDMGLLWENFLMVERRKINQIAARSVNAYFWRTYDRKEIDYIEEYGGKLFGYEFKWGSGNIKQATRAEFLKAYPNAELMTINRDNFETFLSPVPRGE